MPIIRVTIVFIFYIVASFIMKLNSQEEPKKVDTVEVVGKKTEESRYSGTKEDASGFTTVIPVKTQQNRYSSLQEVLEKEAGLRVRRYGGLGSYSTLSIRGSNPNQVKFYLDGVPLNNNMGGEINLSDLAFDNLEQVEVYKSGSSSGFSSSSIGGIVNLVTKKRQKNKSNRITIGGGSYKTAKLNLSHSDYTENWDYNFFVQREKSDQNFTFRNNNGTPIFNTWDDFDDTRKNAWFDRYNFTTNLNYYKDNTTFTLLNDFNYREHGLPGMGNLQTKKVKRKYVRNTTSIGSNSKAFYLENLNLKTRTFYTGSYDHIFDPLSELSYSYPNAKADVQLYGFHLNPELLLLDYNQIIRILAFSERETFRRDRRNKLDVLIDREPRKFRNHYGLQVQDEFRFFDKRLILLPEVQFHNYTDRYNENSQSKTIMNFLQPDATYRKLTNYKFGILGIPYKSKEFIFSTKMNASSEYRVPDFLELFGERGTIIGNTNLIPEKSKNVDAGPVLDWKIPNFEISASLAFFQKTIQNMILFVPNSQYTLRPENIDSANIKGFEFSINTKFYDQWKFSTNYTYQKAINTSNIYYVKGKYLPLRPMHELFSSITYMYENIETSFEAIFIGATFKDRTNEYSNYQPSRILYNYFFTWVLFRKIEKEVVEKEFLFTAEVKNISDKRAYDITGFPLPGRTYYFILSAKF